MTQGISFVIIKTSIDFAKEKFMSFKAKVVKVMIATPGDVANERRLIRDRSLRKTVESIEQLLNVET